MTIDPVFANVALAAAAIVALMGAIAKFRQLDAFQRAVASFRLVPHALVLPFAVAVPVCETLAVAALLAPQTRAIGAVALGTLFALFAFALAVNVARGHTDFDCGCSGFVASSHDAPHRIGWAHVGRALLLVALVACACARQSSRAIVWFDFLSVFGGTLMVVSALVALDVLLANRPKLNHLRNS
ncbi:MauE/DoxX family redox-associated membrane protein [Trinickia dinghuensis]|uniref:Methylamine utilization protein MauE n=1 Tax=Trinickia dinghuensis TaxID=2291023 RepID=A0A3D8JU06_9BURK|nr:MauE/DoxX family redox-associated membrane protein [Trinickia dinghuensis]RDU96370.1 methylamine utilization protein MauE [Trinickia dinghuensis]